MKAGDIFPSVPESHSPLESSPLARRDFECDRFDTFMQRAREHSATHQPKRNESSDDISRGENRKVRSRKAVLKTPEQTDVSTDGSLQASSASVPLPPTASFGNTPPQKSPDSNPSEAEEANVSGIGAIAVNSSGTGAVDSASSSDAPKVTDANNIGEPGITSNSPAASPQNERSNSSSGKFSMSSNVKSELETDSDEPTRVLSPSQESLKETAQSVPPLVLAAQSENTGISSAKYDSPMEKAENMNEFSGTPEQYLPAAASSATEEAPRTFVVRPASSTAREDKPESFSAFSAVSTTTAPTDTFPTTTAQEPASISLQSLERTQELISLHSVQLRASENDSLQVVIKPGADLHLSLNLQMRDGKVEVQALLHHGDFNSLSRHWEELQQQLETRGVRLAPLSDDRNHSQFSDLSQQPGGRGHTRESATRTGAFAEFSPSAVLVSKTSTKTISRNGWESWA
jgi:hypothetical protein